MRSRVLAAIGLGVVLAVALAAWIVPYATRAREEVSAVPVPPPYFAETSLQLREGEEACLSEVAIDTDSRLVELVALGQRGEGPPLSVTMENDDGYLGQANVDGGYELPARLIAEIDPPEESVLAELCVENEGPRAVELLATNDPRTSVARPSATVEGQAAPAKPSVRLLTGESRSVLDRAGEFIDRAAAFKPGVFGVPFLLWLLAVLVVLGVPALAIYAVLASFRRGD